MARTEAVYALRDEVSSRLDRMYASATKLENRLKSLDREVQRKNADFKAWNTTLDGTVRRVNKLDAAVKRLDMSRARIHVEVTGVATAQRQLATLRAEAAATGGRRFTGAGVLPPLGGGSRTPFADAPTVLGTNGPGFRGLMSAGGVVSALGLGPIITGGAGLLGAAGGAVGAAGVGAGAAVPAGAALYGLGGAVYGGMKPALGSLTGGFAAAQGLKDARASGDPKKVAEAQKELDRVLKGLSKSQQAVITGSTKLSAQYTKMFATGARGAQQFGLMNRGIEWLGKTGLPILAHQWDRFFPVFDKNLTKLEGFFSSDKGGRELKQWTKDLPAIADDMLQILGSSGRVFGGFITAISPMAKDGSRGLADWLGKKADWANSTEGIERMRVTFDAAREPLKEFGYGIKEIGKGIVYLTENGGGRAAAGIFKTIGDHAEGFAKFLDDSTGQLPAWGKVIENVGTIIGNVFGPTSSFSLVLGLLAKFTDLVAGATSAVNDFGSILGIAGGSTASSGLGSMLVGAVGAGFLGKRLLGGVAGKALGGAGAKAAAGAGGGIIGRFASSGAGKALTKFGPGKAIGLGVGAYALGSEIFGGPGTAETPYGYPGAPGGAGMTQAQAHAQLGQRSYYEKKVKGDFWGRVGSGAGMGATAGGFAGAAFGGGLPGGVIGAVGGGLVGGLGGAIGALTGGEDTIKVVTAGKRLYDVEKQIAAQTKQRGASLRDLLPQYEKLTKEIAKQKKGGKDYNTLLDERKGIVEQIAQSAPGAVKYGHFGTPTGLHPGRADDQALGGQDDGKPRTKMSVARQMRRLQRGRQLVGGRASHLRNIVGKYFPDRQDELETALASGDETQLLALQRQMEGAGSGHRSSVTKAFSGYQRSAGAHGSLATLRSQVQELAPAFKHFVGTYKEYEEITKRLRREERKHDHDGKPFKPGKGGMGGHFESRGGLPVWVPDAKGGKHGKGGKGHDVMVEGIQANKKEAKSKGKQIADSYADGIKVGSDKAQKQADGVVKAIMKDTWGTSVTGPHAKDRGRGLVVAYATGILEGGGMAASAARTVYDGAVSGLGSTLPGATPTSPTTNPADSPPPARRPKHSRTGGRASSTGAHAKGKSLGKAIADMALADFGGGASSTTGLVPQVKAAIAWAQHHGWHGQVNSGFRSLAEQKVLYARYLAGGNIAAKPGTSNHEFGRAIDVSDIPGFRRAMESAPAGARLKWFGPGDAVHFSTDGHRKGGRIKGNIRHRDSVDALLTPDEFVVTPDGERQLEDVTGIPGVLNMLERSQRPAFQHGGRVGSPALARGLQTPTHGRNTGGGDTFHFHGPVHLATDQDFEATVARLTKELQRNLHNMRRDPRDVYV